MPTEFLVDSEIIVEIEGRASRSRCGFIKQRAAYASSVEKLPLVVFDILVAPGGRPLIQRPLHERRAEAEDFVVQATAKACGFRRPLPAWRQPTSG